MFLNLFQHLFACVHERLQAFEHHRRHRGRRRRLFAASIVGREALVRSVLCCSVDGTGVGVGNRSMFGQLHRLFRPGLPGSSEKHLRCPGDGCSPVLVPLIACKYLDGDNGEMIMIILNCRIDNQNLEVQDIFYLNHLSIFLHFS